MTRLLQLRETVVREIQVAHDRLQKDKTTLQSLIDLRTLIDDELLEAPPMHAIVVFDGKNYACLGHVTAQGFNGIMLEDADGDWIIIDNPDLRYEACVRALTESLEDTI